LIKAFPLFLIISTTFIPILEVLSSSQMKYQKYFWVFIPLLFSLSLASAQKSYSGTTSYYYNGGKFNLKNAFVINFAEELEVIKIRDGEIIADIGSGECFLEGALFLKYKNLTVIANDIDSNKLNNLLPLINFLKPYGHNQKKFKAVLGNDSSTNIKGLTFDKIIIRDALHHFKYPDKILSEVKILLNEGGHFFVSEMLQGETKRPPACNQIFKREDFFKIMNRNGFKLVKENNLPTRNLIVFEFKAL
jgi:ubiquinone/menaquinone biosynthesis C-methylase UbiE